MTKIEAILPSVATKADLAAISERLSTKIDTAVVGLLKDALSAYPARTGNIFALVSAPRGHRSGRYRRTQAASDAVLNNQN